MGLSQGLVPTPTGESPVTRRIGRTTPSTVIRPETVEALANIVKSANDERKAIVVWGGGTRIEIGDFPTSYDMALDSTGLSGVLEYNPADLVVTVRAGTTLAELDSVLAPKGQRWPIEPGLPERATVGGTLSSAAGGPSRLRYFHPRDWALGVQAVLGDGTTTRAGGRVVKNVSGYDLTRLYSGAFGTLCVMTELTLKLTARPHAVVTLSLKPDSLSDAWRMARALIATRLPLDALAVVVVGDKATPDPADPPDPGTVYVRLAGTPGVLARLRESIAREHSCEEVGNQIWNQIAALPLEAECSTRFTAKPGALRSELMEHGGIFYPGVETVHSFEALDQPTATRLRGEIETAGGAMVLERASDDLRMAVGTWGTPRTPGAIARELKRRFDPHGVLAPGRMVT